MDRSYHNTNREKGTTLAKSEAKAKTQEEQVLAFFTSHRFGHFSPAFVNAQVLPDCPLTSVRRAITNLTTQGLLGKTDFMVMGSFGKQVHTWKLKRDSDTLF